MKQTPFTIVYQGDAEKYQASLKSADQAELKRVKGNPRTKVHPVSLSDAHLERVRQVEPKTWKFLQSLSPNLSRTLVTSAFSAEAAHESFNEGLQSLKLVTDDLQQSNRVVTVAVWDLGARVGRLLDIVNVLNHAQSTFTFFKLHAPVPAGLVVTKAHYKKWIEKRAIKTSAGKPRDNNMMSDDFYPFAQAVRKELGVDYLAGITPYMIAGEEDGGVFWNYFAAEQNRVILVSTYDLHGFARQADRPFEAAVAGLVLAQLLVTLNKKLFYHPENRGCMFDLNDDRVSIVNVIRKAEIEPACLDLLETKYRGAAVSMMEALRNYTGDPVESQIPEPEEDETYWVTQLNELTKKLSN